MDAELFAGLAVRPYTVRIAGETYTVRAATAPEWLEAMIGSDPLGVFPGLVDDLDDRDWILECLAMDPGYSVLVQRATRRLTRYATGMDWWVADRLVQIAREQWTPIHGDLTLRGVDVAGMSIGGFVHAVYAWCMRRLEYAKDTERAKFERGLRSIPPDADLDEDVPAVTAGPDLLAAMTAGAGAVGPGVRVGA